MEKICEKLNKAYRELKIQALKFESDLNSSGFEASFEWQVYPNSGFEEPAEYPVPVFIIPNKGTIAFGIDGTVFDFSVSKKKLLKMNFEEAARNHRMEIYTADDQSETIFSPTNLPTDALPKVMTTVADRFRLCVYLPPFITVNTFRALLAEFDLKEENL